MLDIRTLDHFDQADYLITMMSAWVAVEMISSHSGMSLEQASRVVMMEATIRLAKLSPEKRNELIDDLQKDREQLRAEHETKNSQLQKNQKPR
jgi:hypothetical protein